MQQVTPLRYRHSLLVRVECPFCGKPLVVPVEVSITNQRAPLARRVTAATSRRMDAIRHDCIDPTRPLR